MVIMVKKNKLIRKSVVDYINNQSKLYNSIRKK